LLIFLLLFDYYDNSGGGGMRKERMLVIHIHVTQQQVRPHTNEAFHHIFPSRTLSKACAQKYLQV